MFLDALPVAQPTVSQHCTEGNYNVKIVKGKKKQSISLQHTVKRMKQMRTMRTHIVSSKMPGIDHQLSILGNRSESVLACVDLGLQLLMQLKSTADARHISYHLVLVDLRLHLVGPRLQASDLNKKSQRNYLKSPSSVAKWLGCWTCNQQDVGSNPGLPAVECNPGKVVNTRVPLSPSSRIWYQPMGGDALRLGR